MARSASMALVVGVLIASPGFALAAEDGTPLSAEDGAVANAVSAECQVDGMVVETVASQLECEALLALYSATDGSNWSTNAGWNTPTDPCTWNGVSCDTSGIVELDLRRDGLAGSIPTELGDLTNLERLDLSENYQLTGPIPPELGNLINLYRLDLRGSRITGTIPPELGNLTNLVYLFLNGTSHLGPNLTGSLPAELGNLINLEWLGLSGGRLGNQLTGPIPPELGNLTKLRHLNLQGNQLTGSIPPELGNLSSLTGMYIGFNQLSGPIPPELGDVTTLTNMILASNQLTGPIPPELGNPTGLFRFDLHDNQLTGPIPSELGNLTRVTLFYLHDNQLTGPIPSELGNLTRVTNLVLSSNQLTGPIPSELGNLTNLTNLNLEENQLTGRIPPELGNLTNLTNLWLANNALGGDLTIAMQGMLPLRIVTLADGPGGNDCFSTTDPDVATLLDTLTFGSWDECSDAQPPVWTVPADTSVGTDPGAAIATVSYVAVVTDNVGVVSSSCSPTSGAEFSLGMTTVTCTAADAAGNVGTATFDVTVTDTESPEWTVPSDITRIATGLDGASADYSASVTDNVGIVSSECTPGPGSTFPLGVTTVDCSATDAAGNVGTASFDVTIEVDDGSVDTLIDEIEDLGLRTGIERSLQASLKRITKLTEDGNPNNDRAVCGKLDEFDDKVTDRLADGSLTITEAAALRTFGNALKLLYACG